MKLCIEYDHSDALRLLAALILIELVLVAIHLIFGLQGWPSTLVARYFDLDGETTIPAWFSTLQLFSVGMVLLFSSRHARIHRYPSSWFLALMACGFVFLSADEMTMIHERITATLRPFDWIPRIQGVRGEEHGIWIFLYLGVGLAMTAASHRQLRGIWRHHREEAVIACAGIAIFLAGAVGTEVFTYPLYTGEAQLQLTLLVALEEFLEMAGISVVLYASVLFAGSEFIVPDVRLDFLEESTALEPA